MYSQKVKIESLRLKADGNPQEPEVFTGIKNL